MSRIEDLPLWVFETVATLQKWSDEHPKLYGDLTGGYTHLDECGCEALEHVPADVKAVAEVVTRIRRADGLGLNLRMLYEGF